MDKTNKYKKYETTVFERKTLKELYKLSGYSVLTEKESIRMQIELSTPEKVFLLKEV